MIFIGAIILFLPLCCKLMKMFQTNVQHYVKQKPVFHMKQTVTKNHSDLCITKNHLIYFYIVLHSTKHFLINVIPLDSLFSPFKFRRHVIFVIQFVIDEEK